MGDYIGTEKPLPVKTNISASPARLFIALQGYYFQIDMHWL